MATTQATLESVSDASTDDHCDDCLPEFPCAECFIHGDAAFPETAAERHDVHETTPLSEVGN